MNRDKINMMIMSEVKGNWQIQFNSLENKYINLAIDRLVEHVDLKDTFLDKTYVDIFNLQAKVDDAFDYDVVELVQNLTVWQDEYSAISKVYKDALNKVEDSFIKIINEIKQYNEMLKNELIPYLQYSDVDENKLFVRFNMYNKKLVGVIKSLEVNKIDTTDFDLLCDDLLTLSRLAVRRYDRHVARIDKLKAQLNNKPKNDYKKIFDYKEMVRLAKAEGYEETGRYNGDHMIFVYPSSNRIVVIPQKRLGYGLMLSIQKQIETNKAA